MSISIIGIEPEENECTQCGSTENEIVIGDTICTECWMDNEM